VTKNHVNERLAIVLDNEVISAPNIETPILGGSGVITGGFSSEEANELAMLLRSGALPAPLEVLEERTVGAGLGADSIRAGVIASIIGLIAVVLFIIAAYGLFGLFTTATLFINLFLMLGAMSFIGTTLTLPGIAGIILTIGMAVDANVLIFERMREEVKKGRSTKDAAECGFTEAWSTIIDSNLTTLVAAIVLFWFGTGPVRGFAVTLAIGIATSMFTSVTVTRLIIATWIARCKPTKLPI
jgi:preprotein translocase subunit SecD